MNKKEALEEIGRWHLPPSWIHIVPNLICIRPTKDIEIRLTFYKRLIVKEIVIILNEKPETIFKDLADLHNEFKDSFKYSIENSFSVSMKLTSTLWMTPQTSLSTHKLVTKIVHSKIAKRIIARNMARILKR